MSSCGIPRFLKALAFVPLTRVPVLLYYRVCLLSPFKEHNSGDRFSALT